MDPILSEVMDVEEPLTVEVNGKVPKTKTYNIVFVASEAAPYSKTGGLGDVCGSLPISLAGRGHRVMVVTPRYMNGATDKAFSGAFDLDCRINVACFGGVHEVAFFHEYRAGVDWVQIFISSLSVHVVLLCFLNHPIIENVGALQ